MFVAVETVGLRFSEIEHKVYLVVRYSGADLLYAAVRSGQKLFYLKSRCVGDILARNAGRANVML